MADIVLKGITWNHSRGITPLQAAAQRFSELHPEVRIVWEKRSLQQFADYPIEKLTPHYDLLIIDHPWVGTASETKCVLPLDEYLSVDFLKDLENNPVGTSHISYQYASHQWALAIDAAAPAASYRKDLLDKAGIAVPSTWEEVLALARQGKVAAPAISIDLLMNFYTFCLAHGKTPFESKEYVIDSNIGVQALSTMKELYTLLDAAMFEKNPIAVAELMAGTDDYWYCPFAYCYSNYSRAGYAANILHYTDVVSYNGMSLLTTIGGTGLAVSAFSQHRSYALRFAEMICGASYQMHGYTYNEGQPAHKKAWLNELNNQLTNNFFKNVLPVMERSYLRPRYHGYLYFQDHAGDYVRDYLSGKSNNAVAVIEKLNELYHQSLNTRFLSTIE